MTSTNINKIVRSNLQLKPWMLSKNSSEIIDDYIKNMYKQMPNKFKYALKKVKIAPPREENMGPIKQFFSQKVPIIPKITAITTKLNSATGKSMDTDKNSSSKPKNSILKALAPHFPQSEKAQSNTPLKKHTATAANLGARKKLLSPIYKVNSSRRFGSSASSSRSSLYRRRHDDRRAYHYRTNILNSLSTRYYNSNTISNGIDRYLSPSRNQKIQSTLGSIPDAMQVSSAIVNELMMLDDVTLKRLSVHEEISKAAKQDTAILQKENIREVYNSNLYEPTLNKNSVLGKAWAKDSLENRGSNNQNTISNFLRHSKPPAELFTLQHDRYKTELHEKHRKNRMKKLGLMERSPSPPAPAYKKGSKIDEKAKHVEKHPRETHPRETHPRETHRVETREAHLVERRDEPYKQVDTHNTPQKKSQQKKMVNETIKALNLRPPLKSQEANVIKRKWQQNNTDLANSAPSTVELLMNKRRITPSSNQQPNIGENPNTPTDNLSNKMAIEQNKTKSNSPNYVNVNTTDSPTASLSANINANPLAKNYSAFRYNHSHYFSK